jgi:hypothetical protein
MHKVIFSTVAFLFLIIVSGRSNAQKGTTAIEDSGHIEYMTNSVNLKLAQNTDMAELSVNTNIDVNLSPNAASATRLYFNYRFLSFSVGFIPKFLPGNDDDDIRGSTKGSGLGLSLNFNKWLNSFSYSKTKGYYLENTADFNSSWKEGDPYIQFPELQYTNIRGITAYKFNPNYSINAVATQTERQLKSAGSFIPQLVYRYYIIDNKVTSPGGNSQKTNNWEFVLGAGYYHTFVLKKSFYISLGAAPGGGVVFTNLTTRTPSGNIKTNENTPVFRLDGTAGLGYNGEKFFAGLYSHGRYVTHKEGHNAAVENDSQLALQAFVGIRFGAPKAIKKEVDALGRIIKK